MNTLLFVFFVAAFWLGYGARVSALVDRAQEWYEWAKAEARAKKLWQIANTAYNYVDNAHALAAKTESEVDDAFVNKAEAGLKYAIKAMRAMGLDPTGEEQDLILMHFDAIHEAERKAKAASGALPLLPGGDGSAQ
jgi:hypothetical protein